MKRFPSFQIRIFAIFCILVLPFSGWVQAQATNWITSGTGDWNNAGNWDAGVPGNSSAATIAVSGTAIFATGVGNYNTLTLGNTTDGTLIVSGGVLTGTTTSMGSLGNGSLTVTGGTMSSPSISVNSTGAFTGSMGILGGVVSSTSIAGNGGTTAAVTLQGGTLRASANTATLITGFVDNAANIFGASTIDNNGFSAEIPQRISGGSPLTSTGTGILILSGSSFNIFSGSIIINSGTLQFGNGVNGLNAMSNNMTNNGTIVYNSGDSMTVLSTITGTGGLIKQGSTTTLSLGATNPYTGDTVINGGTLRLGVGFPQGGVGGNIIVNSGASLLFNRSGSSTFSGTISGVGTVTVNPTSTGFQTFTANHTYTGATTVSGTFQLGNGGTTGALTSNISNNRTVLFNRSDTYTYGNVISGTGNVILVAGSGALIYTGSNTYTGGTTINLGKTLQIGNGGTTGFVTGPITNSGSLIFNRSNSVTYSGTASGTGSLFQAGTGVLILTGNNTFTGSTIINSGTLQLGNNGSTGSVGNTNILNNGVLVVNRTNIMSISGTISGGGSFVKTATGYVVLLADNTYTGSTVISSGVLQVGGGGTTGFIASTLVQNSGTFGFTRNDDVTYSGTIQGTGVFFQDGATLTLTASNSYTGSTIISNGTLQLGSGGTTGSIDSSLVNNSGTLTFNRSNILIFSGTIQNFGSVIQAGSGTTILTGDNTYTGNTTISAGALQLGNNGPTGSIVGNVVNNGALIVNRTNALTLAGAISGAGSLTQAGSGATTLSGSNSYAGGTFITSGTLIGSTASLQGAISNSSELVFAQSGVGTFIGTIFGTGNATINSSGGGVQFNTNQLYTGTTTINSGGLSVNAQLSSSTVIINSTGTLSGTGTLIGNVINSGGVIQPGTSPGIMTINGNYTQSSNSTLVIEIASNSSFDQLVIGGSASLDGTLTVSLLGGFSPSPGSEFTILTAAAGVSGTFSSLNLPAGFPLQVVYDPTDVRLVFLGSISGSTAQQAAATSAATSSSLGAMTLLLSVLNVPFSEVVPGLAGTVKDILFNVANTEYSQVTTRLAAVRSGVNPFTVQGIPQEPMAQQFSKHQAQYNNKFGLRSQEVSHWDIYAFTSGIFAKLNNISNLPKINSNSGYFGVGADCRINDYVSVGTYTGYQGMWARYAGDSRLQSNGVKCGIYGTAFWEGFYVNAILGGGANFLNFSRSINIADARWSARGNPFAGELDSLLGGGYEYRWKSWVFGANTSIQYTYLGISGFRESQADALNVRVNSQTPSSLVYTLGGNISYLWEIAPNYKILPTLGLSWQHEFLNYGQQIAAAFANGAGAPFFVNSLTAARNNALGFAGITAQIGRRLGAWFYYTPQFGGGQIYSNAFQVGLNYSF